MTNMTLNDILKTDFWETLQTRGRRKPQIWKPGTKKTRLGTKKPGTTKYICH